MTEPSKTDQTTDIPYPIWEFNYKPERYVHPSWVSDLPNADLLQKLIYEDSSHKSTRLSHHLMSQLGFNGKFFFDFSDPITKLALWPGKSLQELVYYVGILFYFDEIRQQIAQKEVRKYRLELGADLYDFALTRAPHLKKKQLKQIVLPHSMPIKQKVLIAGLISLFTAMKSYPAPLLKRFVVKLPRKWFDAYVHYSIHNKIPGGASGNIAIIELIMNELKIDKDK